MLKNAVIDYVREDSYIDSNVFMGNNKNNGVVIQFSQISSYFKIITLEPMMHPIKL